MVGGGISAMPSVHNGLAALFALAAFRIDRKAGWAMTAYAGLDLDRLDPSRLALCDRRPRSPSLLAFGIWKAAGRVADLARAALAERERSGSGDSPDARQAVPRRTVFRLKLPAFGTSKQRGMHPSVTFSGPAPRAFWERRDFVLAIILLSVLPLLWPDVPPLLDLPGHMGRYRVQLDLADLARPPAILRLPTGS